MAKKMVPQNATHPRAAFPEYSGSTLGLDGHGSPESVTDLVFSRVIIPPLYIILFMSTFNCLFNALLNYLTLRRESVRASVGAWTRALYLSRSSHRREVLDPPCPAAIILEEQWLRSTSRGSPASRSSPAARHQLPEVPSTETDYLLIEDSTRSFDDFDNTQYLRGIENPELMTTTPTNVAAPVMEEALANTLDAVRREAQKTVFSTHPTFMAISIAKSLAMVLLVAYHFDYEGGWTRFVVCSAANLMAGELSPIAEYIASWLLTVEEPQKSPAPNVVAVVEEDEPKDSVLIVELLLQISNLELGDLETVFVQCTVFILFGAILLPPAIVFCAVGVLYFIWLFLPLWGTLMFLRRRYYTTYRRPPSQTSAAVPSTMREFLKCAMLKVLLLFLLVWTVQASYLMGLAIHEGGHYLAALTAEVRARYWGRAGLASLSWYDYVFTVSQAIF